MLIQCINRLFTMNENITKEYISCHFCGSNNYNNYDSSNDWNIVKCSKCGHLYTNPRPKAEDLPNYYAEEYFKDERHFDQYYNDDGTVKEEAADFSNRIVMIEHHVLKRGKILEIGAARGNFLKVMKERGWEVDGIEISKDAVLLSKQINDIDLFCGTMEEFTSNEKFDVICMYQTLEHVPNPEIIIRKSYEMLNKNGIILIEVPNIKGYDIKSNPEKRRLIYDLPRHLNHFSPKILSRELTKKGFKTITIDRYYPDFILNFFKNRNSVKVASSSDNNEKKESTSQQKNIPLAKNNISFKGKIINLLSLFFPGWRFTIVGKK